MESLEHWDFAESFSGQEVALLLIGCDPANATSVELKKAHAALTMIRNAYHLALSLQAGNPFVDEEKIFLKSKKLNWYVKRPAKDGVDLLGIESLNFVEQQFARQDVVDWIKGNAVKSKYAFELEPETPEKYRAKVQLTVEKHRGNKTKAGKELGISPQRVGQLVNPKKEPKPPLLRANDPFGNASKAKKLKASKKY
jgi:hypothetical protein